MAAKGSPKTLAVYVIGISGSMDNVGCGKSSMCHQFVYDEYMEESCSTLLQTEFDSPVINRQHTIYWGQSQKTYTYEAITPFVSDSLIGVNFEIFEHTIFYEDGTNMPYSGHENYEKRVFTPLKNFVNKYAFKSRDEVLSPEEYGNKRFSYSKNIPVAYLYVVDVSQPFPIFQEQLGLMNKLVKSIQKKKHCCIVVASKFDVHSKGSVESLESHASRLKVPVIHCSAKLNTHVQAAFRNLAAKALSLKKIVADKPTKQKPMSCTLGQDDDLSSPRRGAIGKSSKVVQPSAASNVPLVPLRSKTLSRNYRNSFLVDDFNTRHLSLGNTLNSVKIPDQYKTLPATSNQSAFDIYMNLPPKSSFSDSSSKTADEKDSDHVQLSVQHGNTNLHTSLMPLSSKPPEVVVSDDSKEESIQQSSEKRSRSTTPLPPTPLYDVVSNGLKESTVQKSSEKLDRSLIPLPHTPLEVAVSNNSSIQQNSERCSRPPSPLPPTPSDTIVSNGLKEESKRSSEKLDRSLIPLPHTPLEIAVSNNSSIQQNSERRSRSPSPLPPIPSDTIVSNGLKGESKRSSEKLDRSLIPLPHTPLEVAVSYNSSIQQNSERRSRPPSPLPPTPSDTIVSNGLKEEIVQKSFKKLDRSEMPLPLTPLEVVVLNNSGEVNMQQSSEKCNRSTMPLPPTPLDAVIFSDLMESSAPATLSTGPEGGTTDEKNTRGMNKSFTDDAQMEEYSSSSDGYERINFDELEKAPTPLPFTADGISTTTDNVTVTNSLGENCTTTVNKEFDRIMQADGSQVNSSLTDTSTLEVVSAVNETSLCMADTRADNDNGTAACLDEDYVISDYEFYSMHKQMQTPLTDSTDQVSSSTPEYLELQGLNPALDDYVPMHKADSQDLKRPSQVHVYDYACHSYMYVEMCRYKLQQSGVPPRRVKREGHTPSVSISSTSTGKNATYVNMKRQHNVTLLPPRSSGADNPNSLSEDHSEPMMPPRNALRIGYYLSAPSAVPK